MSEYTNVHEYVTAYSVYEYSDGSGIAAIPVGHAEPIVRCRDCVHGIKADLSGNWYECMKPDGDGDFARWEVEPDGYCAWACRKSE